MKPIQTNQLWREVLLWSGCALVTMTVACGLLAILTGKEILNRETAKLLTAICSGGILLLFCWLCAVRTGKGKLPAACAVAGLCTGVLLLAKSLLFPSEPVGWDLRFLLPAAAAMTGGLLASRRKVHRR